MQGRVLRSGRWFSIQMIRSRKLKSRPNLESWMDILLFKPDAAAENLVLSNPASNLYVNIVM